MSADLSVGKVRRLEATEYPVTQTAANLKRTLAKLRLRFRHVGGQGKDRPFDLSAQIGIEQGEPCG